MCQCPALTLVPEEGALGLKQASHISHQKLNNVLLGTGFLCTLYDYSVWVHGHILYSQRMHVKPISRRTLLMFSCQI